MSSRLFALLTAFAVGFGSVSSAVADPPRDALLKFYQMPLNNGATPYLVPLPGSIPAGSTYGTVPSTALFPGHDELSTAIRTNPNSPWQGTFMADDFADYAGTPISHVRWWGSYIDRLQPNTGPGVQRFLISFEHNVPAMPNPTNPNEIIPSHPDVLHPDNLHQIVTLSAVPAPTPPAPGTFTEKLIPTPVPAGSPAPKELLYEYNAELHLGKWFNEKVARPGENNVYWLKIVALVDAQETGPLEWGWHNRDWSIRNDLAAMPGDTPDGAERSLTTGIPGAPPLWHFEDNAVSGGIFVQPGLPTMPFMPQLVEQFNMIPQNYIAPWDLPSQFHNQFSKDLAFELYTPIPEPASALLCGLALIALVGWRRHRSM